MNQDHRAVYSKSLVLFALIIRTILFTLFAYLFAMFFYLKGFHDPWETYVNWWVYQAIFGSLLTVPILLWLLKKEVYQL